MNRNPGLQRRLTFFYFSYAVGLIVPIVLGIVLYNRTIETTEREIETRLRFALERSASAISSVYQEVEYLVAQMIGSDLMLDLAVTRYADDGSRLRTLNQLVLNPVFVRSTSYSRFIDDFFIVLPNPGVVLSNKGVISFDSFYQYVFSLRNVDKDDFLESYAARSYVYEFRNENVKFGFDSEYRRVSLLLHAMTKAGVPSALLILVLNERAIRTELETAVFEGGSVVYAHDHRGVSIGTAYTEGPRFKVLQNGASPDSPADGSSIVGSNIKYAMTSPDDSIRLTAFVSRDVVYDSAAYVRRSTLIVVLSLILIDILVVLGVSTRNARPLSRILRMLMMESGGETGGRPEQEKADALAYVDSQLTRVLDRSHSLEDELTKQRPILDSLLLQSLITGLRMEEAELNEILSHSTITLGFPYECCFVVGFSSQPNQMKDDIHKDIIRMKRFLENECARLTGKTSFLIQGYGRFVAVHGADAKSPKAYRDTLAAEMKHLLPSIREYLGADASVGMGDPCGSFTRLSESYEEAVIALDQFAAINQSGFAAYRDYVDSNEDYHFPMEIELRLMSAVRHGSVEEVKQMLDRIRAANFTERKLTRESALLLLHELRGTVVKLNASLKSVVGDNASIELSSCANFPRVDALELCFDTIVNGLVAITEAFRVRSYPRRSGLNAKAIEDFLKKSFRDVNLSLSSTAETFGVSEKYFSRSFKDAFNTNFHVYVETIRLDYIRNKMETTDIPLRDLIQESGYASTITFSRAFKRAFGVNPSAYRETVFRRTDQAT